MKKEQRKKTEYSVYFFTPTYLASPNANNSMKIGVNKIIPIPEDDLEQSGADYTEAHRDERYNAMEHVLASPKSRDMRRLKFMAG